MYITNELLKELERPKLLVNLGTLSTVMASLFLSSPLWLQGAQAHHPEMILSISTMPKFLTFSDSPKGGVAT